MTERDLLLMWMQGDESAAAMLERLFEVSQLADDFIDGDKAIVKDQAMTQLLTLALVEIPANPFYRANHGAIAPVLVAVIAAFETSNRLQKSDDRDCAMMAWALRDSLEHLITVCAYLKAGMTWASEVSFQVTKYFRTNEDRESFEDWVKT